MAKVKKKAGWQIEVPICLVWGRNVNIYELREGVCEERGIKETEGINDTARSQKKPLFYKTASSERQDATIHTDLLSNENGLNLTNWIIYNKRIPFKKNYESVVQYMESVFKEVGNPLHRTMFISEFLCFTYSRSASKLLYNEES